VFITICDIQNTVTVKTMNSR